MKPPVPRPFEPPTDKKPGTADDGTVPKRELPKWLRWETYGQCSHDQECRPKMQLVAGVAIVTLIALGMWLAPKHKKYEEPDQ